MPLDVASSEFARQVGLASLQTAILVLCLLMPGRFLLKRWQKMSWETLPTFRKVGFSLVVSTVVLAAIQSLVLILPALMVRGLNSLLALLALWEAIRWWRTWPHRRRPDQSPEFLLLLALGLFLVTTLWMQWLSPIPGSVEAGYGDIPSYYRIVGNLSLGQFPATDFRIGDYVGEIYFLPTRFPLITLVAASFQSLFPGNLHNFSVLCTLYGLFALFYCGGFLVEGLRLDGTREQLMKLTAGLLPLAFSNNVFDFALGAVSLPALTFMLVLFDLTSQPGSFPCRQALWLGAAFTASFSRPEGLMFVGLLVAFLVALEILRIVARWPKRSQAAFAIVVLVVGGLAIHVPWEKYLGKTPVFFYLHHSPQQKTFVYSEEIGVHWPHILYDNSRESVGLDRRWTDINPRFSEQLRSYPQDYGRWLLGEMVQRVRPTNVWFLTLCGVFLLFSRQTISRILPPLTLTYFVALTCINPAFSPRHSLPLLTLVGAVTLRDITPMPRRLLLAPPRRIPLTLGLLLIIPLLFAGFFHAHTVRQNERESPFLELAETLRPHVQENTRIASRYPQLLAYLLDIDSVGNSILGDLFEPLAERYQPDLIVIDDFRPDILENYSSARRRILREGVIPPYRLLFDDPRKHVLVLLRTEPREESDVGG